MGRDVLKCPECPLSFPEEEEVGRSSQSACPQLKSDPSACCSLCEPWMSPWMGTGPHHAGSCSLP